jgi:hypothetical protein
MIDAFFCMKELESFVQLRRLEDAYFKAGDDLMKSREYRSNGFGRLEIDDHLSKAYAKASEELVAFLAEQEESRGVP